ncbi:beta-ketoacyl-ACP synthase [Francisellaceae bacterium]|nr:beta-ketoacyl-ACP synthase [Francisellaceae bacterium]
MSLNYQGPRRVVVTGMSGITSLGSDWKTISENMRQGKTGVRLMDEWLPIKGMHSYLGAPILDFKVPEHYSRKQLRAMGRVAKLATVATEEALKDADLLDQADILKGGRAGIAYGSCSGSSLPMVDLAAIMTESSVSKVTATTYVKAMSHTCAVNAALFFGLTGRVIPTSSACTSGSQAIGYAYEAIKHGYQDVMLAGGAEELCPSQCAIFDTLYATSQHNDAPKTTPRPFDQSRDGLVIGEGACTLILEERSHAEARGAKIYAEIVGFGTNCDALHVTQPTASTMKLSLELAMTEANIDPDDIGYVCAHGTGTERGDLAESLATEMVLGEGKPISSLKSYFGHTLGACGAIEAWLSIMMMQDQCFMPTVNLKNIDPLCANLDYIKGEEREISCQYIMSNNFAFGGINTSLIFKRG